MKGNSISCLAIKTSRKSSKN